MNQGQDPQQDPHELEESLNMEDFAALEQGNVKAVFDNLRVDQDFDIDFIEENPTEETGSENLHTQDSPEIPEPPSLSDQERAGGAIFRDPPKFGPLADQEEVKKPSLDTSKNVFSEDDLPRPQFEDFPEQEQDSESESPDKKQSKSGFGKFKDKISKAHQQAKQETFDSQSQPDHSPSAKENFQRDIKDSPDKDVILESSEDDQQPVDDFNSPSVKKEKVSFFSNIKDKISKEDKSEDLYFEEDSYQQQIQDLSFVEQMKSKFEMYRNRKIKDNNLELEAGVDITPPKQSLSDKLSALVTDKPQFTAQEKSSFEQLLTPLSGPELAILRSEINQDETIFSTIQGAKNRAVNNHYLGMSFGMIMLAVFAFAVGEDYFVTVLPNLVAPDWVPSTIPVDLVSAVLFCLGIIVPLLTVFIFANGVKGFATLIQNLGLKSFYLEDLLLSITATVCAFGALFASADGNVIGGFAFIVIYYLILSIGKLLGVRM
jgi:hypothetical protein